MFNQWEWVSPTQKTVVTEVFEYDENGNVTKKVTTTENFPKTNPNVPYPPYTINYTTEQPKG